MQILLYLAQAKSISKSETDKIETLPNTNGLGLKNSGEYYIFLHIFDRS